MFSIPEDKLPDCCKDEARINVLYGPFRNKTVNSKDWESKLASWRNLIYLYCTHNKVYSFTLESLKAAFRKNGRTPSCLNVVIGEMLKNCELQVIDDYLKENPTSWKGWATNTLFFTPITWSINKLKNFITDESLTDIYVPLEIIHTQAEQLMASIPNDYQKRIISMAEFLDLVKEDSNKIEELKLIFHYLCSTGKMDMKYLNARSSTSRMLVLKFGDGNKVEAISDVDQAMYILGQNETSLLKEIEKLEDAIASCISEAKLHLSKAHRQLAKASLRKRNEIEKRVGKKINILHNIQTLLEQLRDTHTDSHIVESYKNAIHGFETIFKESKLTEESVDDTMLKLEEIMEINSDIQSSLSKPIVHSDEELENELEELLKNNAGEEITSSLGCLEAKFDNLSMNLPEVPKPDDERPGRAVTNKV